MRLHLSLPRPQATLIVVVADTLEQVRDMLPPGLTMLDRHPTDSPEIHEVWL